MGDLELNSDQIQSKVARNFLPVLAAISDKTLGEVGRESAETGPCRCFR